MKRGFYEFLINKCIKIVYCIYCNFIFIKNSIIFYRPLYFKGFLSSNNYILEISVILVFILLLSLLAVLSVIYIYSLEQGFSKETDVDFVVNVAASQWLWEFDAFYSFYKGLEDGNSLFHSSIHSSTSESDRDCTSCLDKDEDKDVDKSYTAKDFFNDLERTFGKETAIQVFEKFVQLQEMAYLKESAINCDKEICEDSKDCDMISVSSKTDNPTSDASTEKSSICDNEGSFVNGGNSDNWGSSDQDFKNKPIEEGNKCEDGLLKNSGDGSSRPYVSSDEFVKDWTISEHRFDNVFGYHLNVEDYYGYCAYNYTTLTDQLPYPYEYILLLLEGITGDLEHDTVFVDEFIDAFENSGFCLIDVSESCMGRDGVFVDGKPLNLNQKAMLDSIRCDYDVFTSIKSVKKCMSECYPIKNPESLKSIESSFEAADMGAFAKKNGLK